MPTLTADQEKAKAGILKFLSTRDEHVLVLKGYAGTGKTTLIKQILLHIPKMNKLAKIVNPKHQELAVSLCATTHKAAEALSNATGREVNTIHSHLSLRVRTDFTTGKQHITRSNTATSVTDEIIFIDESSYIDEKLLNMILMNTDKCKLIFIGDPAQLAPVKQSTTPVFERGFPTVELLQVVRQEDGNPIKEWCNGIREFIRGERDTLPKLKVDNQYIHRLDRHDFDTAVLHEFVNPKWKAKDSKLLAWRNATVNRYNKALHKKASGNADLTKGDYAVNNHYVTVGRGKFVIKTDATVLITSVTPDTNYGFKGKWVDTENCSGLFQVDDIKDREYALAKAVSEGDSFMVQQITDTWCDLRAAYACTVNKSQGSTFDKVFIDLDDITACSDMNNMARMLYVALSRTKSQVVLTGG